MSDDRDSGGIDRVTNPERYAVLYDVADQLLDELEMDYLVDRFEGSGLDTRLLGNGDPSERIVRLVPSTGRGAPLTVDFMAFPGLHTRFGRWRIEMFPSCGCDYCGEDPQEVAEMFTDRVRALVAGGFDETPERATFRGSDWTSSSWGHAGLGDDLPAVPEPPAGGWGPWAKRAASPSL